MACSHRNGEPCRTARPCSRLGALTTVAAQMDAMIARGFGHLDWTVIGKDLVKPG
jgi:hypothetical protein